MASVIFFENGGKGLEKYRGHIAASITVLIWATTFISTKVILRSFLPIEILFIRFLLGFVALLVISPKILPFKNWKEEFYFACAGICGVFLYYYLENVALTYTYAMNVGVIGSVAPFMTALLNRFVLKEGRLYKMFILGFIVSMLGILCISLNGAVQINPIGDGLAVIAVCFWAVYSLLVKKISDFGYGTIATTQRVFFYGLVAMIPTFIWSVKAFDFSRFFQLENFGNLLFLGLGASALCFVTWNYSLRKLGVVRSALYIYTIPMLTTIASVILLHEKLTLRTVLGIALTLLGLFLSELPNFQAARKLAKEK